MPDKLKILSNLAEACKNCGMCGLGWDPVRRDSLDRDPHVFGELPRLSPLPKYMIVGQNPGWHEVVEGRSFVGQAGKKFEMTLLKYGEKYSIDRDWFYITNTCKCFSKDNARPTAEQIGRCRPFLDMELQIIRPRLVVTLGEVAFSAMCPGVRYSEAIGKITGAPGGWKVFATYHPSPLNFADKDRERQFERDIQLLVAVMARLELPF